MAQHLQGGMTNDLWCSQFRELSQDVIMIILALPVRGFLANVNSYQLTSTNVTAMAESGECHGPSNPQVLERHRSLLKSEYQYSPALGAQSSPPGPATGRQIDCHRGLCE